VIDGESQRDSGQRTCICGVARGDRLSHHLDVPDLGGSEDHDQPFLALFVVDALDLGLLIQVRGTGARSDKALIQLEQHLGTSAARHCRDGRRLYSVPFADRDDLLAM
jgi:hypothetical protein